MVRLWLVRVPWFAYFLVSSNLGLKAFRWQYLSKRFKTKRVALVWTISTVLLVFLAVVDPTQTNSIPELGVLGPVCRFLSPRSQGNVNPL